MNHPQPTDLRADRARNRDGEPDQRDTLDAPAHDEPVVVAAPDALEVRRNAPLAAAVGVAAAAVAIAYLGRASATGGVLDWALCGGLAALAVVHLLGFLDSRAPLLVADAHGVRIRLGRTWQGVPWADVESVEVSRRRGLIRDGALRIHPHAEEALIAGLDAAGRRRAAWARRLRGASLSVPLSVSTRVVAAERDLVVALDRLVAAGAHPVDVVDLDAERDVVDLTAQHTELDTEPQLDGELGHREDPAVVGETGPHEQTEAAVETPTSRRRLPDLRPGLARGIGALAARLPRRTLDAPLSETATSVGEPEEPSTTPEPSREPVSASRSELLLDDPDATEVHDAVDLRGDGRELRRPGHVSLVEDTVVWSDRVPRLGGLDAGEGRVLIDDLADRAAAEPAADPVIGPQLAAARGRLGLSVDQLAERTRIRPHVIESLEVDDFVPCGGDFYARGHLRTLARVLGLDAGPLLAAYDERYADAEISPRRVFEAELAGGPHGPIRGTRGGPNWSVLVAAVMALVLVWSVARLLTDGPIAVDDTPALNGSPGLGLSGSGQKLAEPVPVVLTAAGGGAHVVVRDGGGRVVFTGDVAFGDSRELEVSPPVRVQSSDGSLEVSVAGGEPDTLGSIGEPAQNTFLAP
ncbi:helix-turn-helix domain-containing protein [Nocardioides ferulae]|uniref:helix-turn-helix domain-containing protein n=1 Tax=Nocardioides ferulae TaxID=2340821 RepID=UPI000EB5BE55|nr:helix-turn-helix domain-containing protein [Nocardioides ferulae]